MSTLQEKYDAQTAGDGIGGTDAPADIAPTAQKPIYRALLTYAEMIACGLHDQELLGNWAKAVALLRAKGIPDVYLLHGAPVRASEVNGGLLLEFE